MICVRKLLIEFIDTGTGDVIRQYPYQVTGDDDGALYCLINSKRLSSYLSSFIRGCYKNDHLQLRLSYDKDLIF